MKSWKKPTTEEVEKVVSLLTRKERYRYFFAKLDNPEWIEPLSKKGYFISPPPPIQNSEQGTISFPNWPESQYLSRMAEMAPQKVIETLLEMEDVENPNVYSDIVECVLQIPLGGLAENHLTSLFRKIKKIAKTKYLVYKLPEKLLLLAVHFSKYQQTDEALRILSDLLVILPDSSYEKRPDSKKIFSPLPHPQPKLQLWEYEQLIKKDYPSFTKCAGIDALRLLCDLAEQAVRYSQSNDNGAIPEDYSYIWMPAVEKEDEIHHYKVANILVSAIISASTQLIQTDAINIRVISQTIDAKQWWVFRRSSLYLLSEYADDMIDLIADHIIDKSLFDSFTSQREYRLLVSRHFGKLSPKQQRIVLDWINDGPDIKGKTSSAQDEQQLAYKNRWRRDRLSWIVEHLPEPERTQYEELVSEIGTATEINISPHSGVVWVGPTSPKTVNELKKMSVDILVEYLKTWKPSVGPYEPTPEGLGRIIDLIVKDSPEQFGANASLFKGLEPTYIRHLLKGLEDAMIAGKSFNWLPVLGLIDWILNQKDEYREINSDEFDSDINWRWTRSAVASLIGQGFREASEASLPIELRERVWKILLPITHDIHPTLEDDIKYGPPNMDPAMYSMNTTRGVAMHSVVQYALWVYRSVKDSTSHFNFKLMPEVSEVLDEHLDLVNEPSVAVRAVYGQWFPWLVLMDSDWARENILKIFPIDKLRAKYRQASWNTYIIFCNPYDNVFEILKQQYELAVQDLGDAKQDQTYLSDPECKLAEHLMAYYW
ncbi:MAG: hypothetical protein WBW94_11460, partial [Anaerolineales bacterium]